MNTRLRCPSVRTSVIGLRCRNGRVLSPRGAVVDSPLPLVLVPPPSDGGGYGRGRPQDECSKISDLKPAKITVEALPLPTLPRQTGEDLRWRLSHFLGCRQQLVTAGIRCLHGPRYLAEAVFGELLAVAQLVDV